MAFAVPPPLVQRAPGFAPLTASCTTHPPAQQPARRERRRIAARRPALRSEFIGTSSRPQSAAVPAPVAGGRDAGRRPVDVVCRVEKVGNTERFDWDEKNFIQVQVRSGDFVSQRVFVAVLEELEKTKSFQPRVVQERIERARERRVLPVFMNAFEGAALAAASRTAIDPKRPLRFYFSLLEHLWRARSLVTAVLNVAEGRVGEEGVGEGRDLGALFAGLVGEVRKGTYASHHDWLLGLLRSARFRVFQVALTPTARADAVTACVFLEGPDGRNLFVRALPSDALALAVRAAAPIYVAREVWADAAFEPVATTFGATAGNSSVATDFTATATQIVLGGGVPPAELAPDDGPDLDDGRLGGVGALDPAAERPFALAGPGQPAPPAPSPAGPLDEDDDEDEEAVAGALVIEVFRTEDGALAVVAEGPGEGLEELARETALAYLQDELDRAVAEERYEEAGRLVREEPLLRLAAAVEAAVKAEEYGEAAERQRELEAEVRRLLAAPPRPPRPLFEPPPAAPADRPDE